MDFVRLPLSPDARATHCNQSPCRLPLQPLAALHACAPEAARHHCRAQGVAHFFTRPPRLCQVDKMNTKLPNFGGSNAAGNDSKYFQTTKKGAPSRPRAPQQ